MDFNVTLSVTAKQNKSSKQTKHRIIRNSRNLSKFTHMLPLHIYSPSAMLIALFVIMFEHNWNSCIIIFARLMIHITSCLLPGFHTNTALQNSVIVASSGYFLILVSHTGNYICSAFADGTPLIHCETSSRLAGTIY